jgi:hypothetical protein
MPLRHVVTWKVAGDSDAEREQVKAELRDLLLALPAQIEDIRTFEVGLNNIGTDNFDVVLISDFDDEAGLQRYTRHPVHQKVIAFVRAHTVGRAAVDILT